MASVLRGSGDSSFGGNLSIEGVLTYEDVTSVDSVGVITARSGIVADTTDTSASTLTLQSKGGGTNDGHLLGEGPKISFNATRSADGANSQAAYIQQTAIGDLSSSWPVDLAFGVRRFGSSFEALRITSTGQLQATGAADVRLTLGSSGTAGTNDSVHIRADSADLKFMAANGGTTIFETNGTETLRIGSGGLLTSTRTSTTAYDSAATTNDSGFLLLNNGGAGHATLQFQSLSGGTAQTGQATISALNESASSKSTSLTFGTRQNSDSTVRERLRLTSDGKLILSMTQRTTPHLEQGDGAMLIEQSYGGNLTALTVRNKDTDAAAATSIGFSLNRTGGDYDFVSGQIKSIKEQSWTTTDSTIDSAMVFSTTGDNTLTERLRITSLGQTIYYGESGNAAGTTATNHGVLSANGTLDLKIPGTTIVGHLYVTSVLTSNANARTTKIFYVSIRLNSSSNTITQLQSTDGPSGSRALSITEASGGSFPNKLRFTDTSNSAVTVTMHFVGAVGL